MKERYFNIMFSILISFAIMILLIFAAMVTPDGTVLHRIIVMLGGEMPGGLIQGLTYFLFFFGMFEILKMNKKVRNEEKSFSMELLPETEQLVLSPEDVARIKLSMIEIERKHPLMLVNLIKKACTKFRSSYSVSETLDMVSKQAEINFRNSDSEQSIIRYAAWAIPSVGFVGTVLGIAASLSEASSAVSAAGIERMTDMLNIAFDTTLLALILSMILMLMYHNFQEANEKLHARIETYVLDNLVNRIYHT
jgi:biopolymer transport protein ExbB/TolQ